MTTYFYVLWFYHYNVIIVSSFHGVLVSTHLQVLYMYSVGTLLVSVQTLIQFKWRCWGQKERGGGREGERDWFTISLFFFTLAPFYLCSTGMTGLLISLWGTSMLSLPIQSLSTPPTYVGDEGWFNDIEPPPAWTSWPRSEREKRRRGSWWRRLTRRGSRRTPSTDRYRPWDKSLRQLRQSSS